jgi:hypothetical protein
VIENSGDLGGPPRSGSTRVWDELKRLPHDAADRKDAGDATDTD